MGVRKRKFKKLFKFNKKWMILSFLAIMFFGWQIVKILDKALGVMAKTVEKSGVVARVADGDTFTLASGTVVRMANFTAPIEGEAASNAAAQLSKKLLGKKVWLQYDSDQNDPFGRVRAVVWIGCEKEPNFSKFEEDKPEGCKKGNRI